MNMKVMKPFVGLLLLVLVVGLACNLGRSSSDEPTVPPSPTTVPPTELPPPTSVPATAEAATAILPTSPPPPTAELPTLEPPPTEEIVDGPPAYYIEEFEGDLSNYSYFVFLGEDTGSEMFYTDGGSLVFELQDLDTWVYFTYDPWYYEDVRVGMRVENRGVNSQRVSLTCMVSEEGWFEFNIGGDGLYEIYVYDAFDDRFALVGNGGSTDIRLGRDSNEYIAECIDDALTLYINGEFVKSFAVPDDYRYLDEGAVGFAVSSFDVAPVRLSIDWFGIEAP